MRVRVGQKKIRSEDHRLASRGLPSDDKRWSWGTDFLSYLHMKYGFFFLLTTFSIWLFIYLFILR